MARIPYADLTSDQVSELDVEPAQQAITIGMQWLCRNAANIAFVEIERGEGAQLWPERGPGQRVIKPAMPNIDLTIAVALVNDGAILGDGRPIVI